MIRLCYCETRSRLRFGQLVLRPLRRGQRVRFCRVYSTSDLGELFAWAARHDLGTGDVHFVEMPQIVLFGMKLHEHGYASPEHELVDEATYEADLAAWRAAGKPTTAVEYWEDLTGHDTREVTRKENSCAENT